MLPDPDRDTSAAATPVIPAKAVVVNNSFFIILASLLLKIYIKVHPIMTISSRVLPLSIKIGAFVKDKRPKLEDFFHSDVFLQHNVLCVQAF